MAVLLLVSGPAGLWLGEVAAFRNVHLAVAAALAVLAWRRPAGFAQAISPRSHLGLRLAALVWLGFASWSHWADFAVNGVDFSIFDWMVQSTHDGHFGYSPIYAVNHFGVHSSFLLLALVPLHALWPSPLWLVALGPVLVWAGLFPLRRLSRALVGEHGGLELVLALGWLGNAWLGRLVNGVFRIESFTPLLTVWFLVAWVERRGALLALSVGALLCAKEDAALALTSFSVASLVFERARRRDAALVLAGAVTFLLGYTQVAQPFFARGATPSFWAFWSDFGQTPRAIIWGILTSPGVVVGRLVTSGWWRLFAPLLLLPFGSLRAVSGLLPTFLLLGIANYEMMHEYQGYYPSPLVAWALFGALVVLGRWRAQPRRFALGVCALIAFPLFDGGYAKSVPVDWGRRAALPEARAALRAPATIRCVQPVLMPQVGYPENVNPMFETRCVEEPGAMGLVAPGLDPYPLTVEQLDEALIRWRAQGRVRELAGGFLVVASPPPAPSNSAAPDPSKIPKG